MSRVNYPLTIDELYKACLEQRKKGNGSKYILLSNDEEGNGFHECYYAITEAEKAVGCYCDYPSDLNLKDCVVLG